MASKLLGRVPCVEPNCGFQSAHIKINIDTPGKKPYRYCPECTSQFFPKTEQQVRNMMSTMRAEATNTPPEAEVGTAAEPGAQTTHQVAPELVQEPRFKMVFGVKVPV